MLKRNGAAVNVSSSKFPLTKNNLGFTTNKRTCFFVVKPRYPQTNHGFAALTVVFVVKLVIQM